MCEGHTCHKRESIILEVHYCYQKWNSLGLKCQKPPQRRGNRNSAKLNLAELFLQRREYAKIPAIFDHNLDLKLLYPHREKFHVSEVVNFMGTLGLYFTRIGERTVAEAYYDLLQQVAPGEQMTKRLKRELYPSALRRLVNRLGPSSGTRENETE